MCIQTRLLVILFYLRWTPLIITASLELAKWTSHIDPFDLLRIPLKSKTTYCQWASLFRVSIHQTNMSFGLERVLLPDPNCYGVLSIL